MGGPETNSSCLGILVQVVVLDLTEIPVRGVEELQEHLRMTDFQSRERMAVLMDQGMKCLGITEDLKKRDRMEWIRQTNNLYHSAEENVKQELIYC